jgi:hypothetical protein
MECFFEVLDPLFILAMIAYACIAVVIASYIELFARYNQYERAPMFNLCIWIRLMEV